MAVRYRSCSSFASQAEANAYIRTHSGARSNLDSNSNGQACEVRFAPKQATQGGPYSAPIPQSAQDEARRSGSNGPYQHGACAANPMGTGVRPCTQGEIDQLTRQYLNTHPGYVACGVTGAVAPDTNHNGICDDY
jgi:hypothetical protein